MRLFPLALLACATHPLPAGSDREAPVCLFANTVFMHATPLEVPGGDFVYARINLSAEAFPTLRGALHEHHEDAADHRPLPPDVVLEMQLEHDGYGLWAETSARDQPIFSTTKAFAVSDFGQVMPGAPLKLVAGRQNEVQVQPAAMTTEDLKLTPLPNATLRCDELSLHILERPAGLEEKELTQLGLAPTLHEALLAPGEDVELHATPGGPVRAVIAGHAEGHDVRVIGEHTGTVEIRRRPGDGATPTGVEEQPAKWSRIVAAHWAGVYWFGWVKSEQLRDAVPEKAAEAAPPGGSPPASLPSGLRCSSDLDLFAEKSGNRHPIGHLAKNTAFKLLGGDGEFAVLDTQKLWFTLEPGVRLEVPEKARACAPVP